MKVQQWGFTLIELMLVVAIIGILAAIAIPSYQSYLARAQVTEAIGLTSGVKTAIKEWYSDKARYPAAPASINAQTNGKYVSNITFTVNGTSLFIDATMKATAVSADVASRTYRLETPDGGDTWRCGNLTSAAPANPIDGQFLPAACK